MSNEIGTVTHVIFDLDGLVLSKIIFRNETMTKFILRPWKFSLCTRIDTESIYEKVYQEVLAQYGKALTPEVRMKLLGSSERTCCDICINELNLDVSADDFMRNFSELSLKQLAKVEFMPGAEKLIRHLHAKNIPICVATSSREDSVKVKTSRHGEIFKLFNHITYGNDSAIKRGKPAPDIFLFATTQFSPKPEPSKASHKFEIYLKFC